MALHVAMPLLLLTVTGAGTWVDHCERACLYIFAGTPPSPNDVSVYQMDGIRIHTLAWWLHAVMTLHGIVIFSSSHADFELGEEELIRHGKHVLVASVLRPKAQKFKGSSTTARSVKLA